MLKRRKVAKYVLDCRYQGILLYDSRTFAGNSKNLGIFSVIVKMSKTSYINTNLRKLS